MSRKDQRKIIILGMVHGIMQRIKKTVPLTRNDKKTTERIEGQVNKLLNTYPEPFNPTIERKVCDVIYGLDAKTGGSIPSAALITCMLDCVERERDYHPKEPTWRNLAGSLFTLLSHVYDGWVNPNDDLAVMGMDLAGTIRSRI